MMRLLFLEESKRIDEAPQRREPSLSSGVITTGGGRNGAVGRNSAPGQES